MLLKEPWTVLGIACWITLGSASHDPFCWKQSGSYCEMPWDVVHGHHDDYPTDWIGSPNTVIASTSGSNDQVHLQAADITTGPPVIGSPVLTFTPGTA